MTEQQSLNADHPSPSRSKGPRNSSSQSPARQSRRAPSGSASATKPDLPTPERRHSGNLTARIETSPFDPRRPRPAPDDLPELQNIHHKMPQYTSRDVGDPTQIKKNKQSMADLKLRRLTELNNRLREDLDRERIPVSQAAKSIIAYCNGTRDYMVPSVWGVVPKGEDPYAPQQSGGCCVVM
ncbi:GGL domain-containing protein [Coniochaeta sp. 2T2.1]|nr:GGL domain-containing protein [Coniochaeta sp. 2T2.1]